MSGEDFKARAGRVIEGVFDGENMIGPDGKQYSVPANYASKSKLVEGDILKMKISDLLNSHAPRATSYKLITNLPYHITSAFLKKFLIEPPAPERIVVMLQAEVANRICASATCNLKLD